MKLFGIGEWHRGTYLRVSASTPPFISRMLLLPSFDGWGKELGALPFSLPRVGSHVTRCGYDRRRGAGFPMAEGSKMAPISFHQEPK